jgi:hypothetical protein
MDAGTLVSLILAGGAFFAALASLYLTNLKRASIQLLPLSQRHRVTIGSGVGVGGLTLPSDVTVQLVVSAHNGGARAGVLTSVRMEEMKEEPESPHVFKDVPSLPIELFGFRPEGFEAGDVDFLEHVSPFQLGIAVSPVSDSPSDLAESLAEFHRLLGPKTHLRFRLSWTYVKGHRRFRRALREGRGEVVTSASLEALKRDLGLTTA